MKNLVNLFLIATAIVLISGCSVIRNTENTTKAITSKDLEFVGIEHNKLLDNVYNEISKKKPSQEEGKKIIEKIIFDYLKSLKETEVNKKFAVEYTKKSLINSRDELSNLYPNETSKLVSDNEKKHLDALFLILSKNNSVEEVNSEISNLENQISKEKAFNNKQLVTLFSATQTARHSYQYWTKNGKKWNDIYNDKDIIVQGFWGDVGKSDAGGAAGGAAGAAVVNVIPGAGQVAYGGAIIGGAVGCSVGTAVGALWDWAFG